MSTKLKTLDWSYPTSPNAVRLGFLDGCWTVSVQRGTCGLPVAISGHHTKEEALAVARMLPAAWHPIYAPIYGDIATPSTVG